MLLEYIQGVLKETEYKKIDDGKNKNIKDFSPFACPIKFVEYLIGAFLAALRED